MGDVLAEIHELNLSYLVLAQRLLKQDYATARYRLKLDDDMAVEIMSLSAKQLGQLASTNQFLFRLCFADASQLTKIFEAKRDPVMAQTHAALLLASAA